MPRRSEVEDSGIVKKNAIMVVQRRAFDAFATLTATAARHRGLAARGAIVYHRCRSRTMPEVPWTNSAGH